MWGPSSSGEPNYAAQFRPWRVHGRARAAFGRRTSATLLSPHERCQLDCLRTDVASVILALGGRPGLATTASAFATGWPVP